MSVKKSTDFKSLFGSLAKLGEKIESENTLTSFTADQFTELATSELQAFMQNYSFTQDDFIDEIFELDEMVAQLDPAGDFGTPPITIYDGKQFVVDIYHWNHADTSIHSHGFCGAFAVLSGKTLHIDNSFTCEQSIFSTVQLGKLRCKNVEVLKTGDVHTIYQGPDFMHAAIHLKTPAITLCVRSKTKFEATKEQQGYQLSFMRPSLLFATVDIGGVNNLLHAKQRQFLSQFISAKHPKLPGKIKTFKDKLGNELALLNLLLIFQFNLPEQSKFKEILAVFKLSAQVVEGLYQAFVDRKNLINWRQVKTVDQKTVAALMEAGVSSKKMVLILNDMNSTRVADILLLSEVILELAENKALPIELNETAKNVLLGIVLGMEKQELIASLAQQYQQQSNPAFADEITQTYNTLTQTPLFLNGAGGLIF